MMTRYHGGKMRIAKYLAPFIEARLSDDSPTTYCEPFCGMLSIFDAIAPYALAGKRVLISDIDKDVAAMWQAAQSGHWDPPQFVDAAFYHQLKRNPDADAATRCFVGHQYSFIGTYFNTFSPLKDPVKVARRVRSIGSKLHDAGAEVRAADYRDILDLTNAVVYCDPPYANTHCRFTTSKFDNDAFWDWCRATARTGNHIFISEFSAPSDFACLYEHPTRPMIRGRAVNHPERLFYLSPPSNPVLQKE